MSIARRFGFGVDRHKEPFIVTQRRMHYQGLFSRMLSGTFKLLPFEDLPKDSIPWKQMVLQIHDTMRKMFTSQMRLCHLVCSAIRPSSACISKDG
jgi:hypothetical protein